MTHAADRVVSLLPYCIIIIISSIQSPVRVNAVVAGWRHALRSECPFISIIVSEGECLLLFLLWYSLVIPWSQFQ